MNFYPEIILIQSEFFIKGFKSISDINNALNNIICWKNSPIDYNLTYISL